MGPIAHSIEIKPVRSPPGTSFPVHGLPIVLKANDSSEAYAWVTVLTNPLVGSARSVTTVNKTTTAASESSPGNVVTLPETAVLASSPPQESIDSETSLHSIAEVVTATGETDTQGTAAAPEIDAEEVSAYISQLQDNAQRLTFECEDKDEEDDDEEADEVAKCQEPGDREPLSPVSSSAPAITAASEESGGVKKSDTSWIRATDASPTTANDAAGGSSSALSFSYRMAATTRPVRANPSGALPADPTAPISKIRSSMIEKCTHLSLSFPHSSPVCR